VPPDGKIRRGRPAENRIDGSKRDPRA
jgi:hypothetical protein